MRNLKNKIIEIKFNTKNDKTTIKSFEEILSGYSKNEQIMQLFNESTSFFKNQKYYEICNTYDYKKYIDIYNTYAKINEDVALSISHKENITTFFDAIIEIHENKITGSIIKGIYITFLLIVLAIIVNFYNTFYLSGFNYLILISALLLIILVYIVIGFIIAQCNHFNETLYTTTFLKHINELFSRKEQH